MISANAGYFLPDSVFHFRLVDSTGVLVESFGVRDRQALAGSPFTDRLVTYAGGDRFWAGPPTDDGHSPVGYELEEWSVDGERLKTLRREVPRLPISWPPPPPATHDRPTTPAPRPPAIRKLHLDDDGVLLVIVVYATDKWLPPVEALQLPSEQQIAMFEYRVE